MSHIAHRPALRRIAKSAQAMLNVGEEALPCLLTVFDNVESNRELAVDNIINRLGNLLVQRPTINRLAAREFTE